MKARKGVLQVRRICGEKQAFPVVSQIRVRYVVAERLGGVVNDSERNNAEASEFVNLPFLEGPGPAAAPVLNSAGGSFAAIARDGAGHHFLDPASVVLVFVRYQAGDGFRYLEVKRLFRLYEGDAGFKQEGFALRFKNIAVPGAAAS